MRGKCSSAWLLEVLILESEEKDRLEILILAIFRFASILVPSLASWKKSILFELFDY